MNTQFVITETGILPNGNILASGKTIGPSLAAGKQGRATTFLGKINVQIVSIGIIDFANQKSAEQALQIKIIEGKYDALKGATLVFE